MHPLSPPLHTRLRPGHWVAIDCAVTALIALGYAVVWKGLATMAGPHWVAATVIAVAVAPAALRRRGPRTALVLVAGGHAVATAMGARPQPALAVAFVMYLIALRLPLREALWWLAGTLVAMAAGVVALGSRVQLTARVRDATSVLFISALLVAIAWLVGYSVRQQHSYNDAQRRYARQQALEELADARRAISEQRLEIARELHDVVAHTMTLIAVQAGVANYVIKDDPQEAVRALTSIEQTSRGALKEMRALLGVLRTDDGYPTGPEQAGEAAPALGLAGLDGLVERAAQAGLAVELDIRGERPTLAPGLDLAAYRVLQEAITNVIKHAATDRCDVTIASERGMLTLRVTDRGSGSGREAAAGHGIVGMRERAGMYGGRLRAAPLPGHGFEVTAEFPLIADGT